MNGLCLPSFRGLAILLVRFFRRVFMDPFPESTAHGLARKIVESHIIAQPVGRSKRPRHFCRCPLQQIHLLRRVFKSWKPARQQPDGTAIFQLSRNSLPAVEKISVSAWVGFVSEWASRDGAEIGITKFKLERPRGKVLLTQTAALPFRKAARASIPASPDRPCPGQKYVHG